MKLKFKIFYFLYLVRVKYFKFFYEIKIQNILLLLNTKSNFLIFIYFLIFNKNKILKIHDLILDTIKYYLILNHI